MAQSKSLKSVFSYQSWIHAVSGATGGVVAMSVFYPLDTIRLRLQLDDPECRKTQNTFKILLQLAKDEGIYSLYRGLIPVLESLCISNFVYFYTFHSLKALSGSPKNQSVLKDLMLGIVAGVVNVLTTTPFWVVNTRLKLKGLSGVVNESNKHYDNLVHGLFYVGRTEGMSGLWAGTIPSLLLVINPALQFMMYEAIKRKLTKVYGELPSLSYFAIGAAAKAFATVLTYPLQLVQTKQRHGGDKTMGGQDNTGTIKLLLHIVKSQGAKGLFRGLEAKMLQTILTAALMFATYEKIATTVTSALTRQPRIK